MASEEGTRIIRFDASRRRMETTQAQLRIRGPEAGSRIVEITGSLVTIGKDPTCHIVLSDTTASRRHARISYEDGEFILEDLRSTNGTWINNARVDRARLRSGSDFTVGKTDIRLELKVKTSALGQRLPQKRGGILGDHPSLREVLLALYKLAPTDVSVLLAGESGTGKELAARFLHQQSNRRNEPFVAFNCSAITPELFESELFGHKKGSFTGAASDRKGLFEMADGGTLFLDEIGEMPLNLQPKLLRTLEDGMVRPVGASRELPTNVRVLAATNRDLALLVKAGKFRRDLYYRLVTVPVQLPPLRQRGDDVLLLAHHFLANLSSGSEVTCHFDEEAKQKLKSYSWPGNVRELKNIVAAAFHLAAQPPMIRGGDIRLNPLLEDAQQVSRTLDEIIAEGIRKTLTSCDGDAAQAAKILDVAPSTFYDKMKKYGIRPSDFRKAK